MEAGRRSEVIVVRESLADVRLGVAPFGALASFDPPPSETELAAPLIEFVTSREVVRATDAEHAQVAAAAEPQLSQEAIGRVETRLPRRFDVEPKGREPGSRHAKSRQMSRRLLRAFMGLADPRLRQNALSTLVTADVPIVAERSMYWRAGDAMGRGEQRDGIDGYGATLDA
jgi:hypothetical protein